MKQRRVAFMIVIGASLGVAVACGPQNRVTWSNNPDLHARFSNLSLRSGKIGGAILVTDEDGMPVSIKSHGIVVETMGADGQWHECAEGGGETPAPSASATATDEGGETPAPTASTTPTNPDDTPTPTPTNPDDTPTPTPTNPDDTPTPTPTATPGEGATLVDAAIVGDMSGSVYDFEDEIRTDVKDLGDQMLSGYDDRIGLVRVSSGSSKLSELTTSVTDFDAATDQLVSHHGWTALWDGIRMGNEIVDVATTGTRYKAIVVFTDGKENNSADEHDTGYDDGIDTTYDDLLALQAQGVATAIWTVGVGNDIDETALQGLADATGGEYLHIADYTQLLTALHQANFQIHAVKTTAFAPASCEATQARISVHTDKGWTQTVIGIPSTCP